MALPIFGEVFDAQGQVRCGEHGPERRPILAAQELSGQQQRDDAALPAELERALHEGHREVGLRAKAGELQRLAPLLAEQGERRGCALRAEEPVALFEGAAIFGGQLAESNPGRVADHPVEAATVVLLGEGQRGIEGRHPVAPFGGAQQRIEPLPLARHRRRVGLCLLGEQRGLRQRAASGLVEGLSLRLQEQDGELLLERRRPLFERLFCRPVGRRHGGAQQGEFGALLQPHAGMVEPRMAEEGVALAEPVAEVGEWLDGAALLVGHGGREREPEAELSERDGGGGEVDAEEVLCQRLPECLVCAERLVAGRRDAEPEGRDELRGLQQEGAGAAGGIEDTEGVDGRGEPVGEGAGERSLVASERAQQGGCVALRGEVCEPEAERLFEQVPDQRGRRVEGAGAGALLVVHEPLEDMAEHAGIDGLVVGGLFRFDEAVALEEVADEVAERLVREVERRVALLERGGRKEAAVEVGDVAEAERL